MRERFTGTALVEGNQIDNGGISADTGADPTIRGNVIHRSRSSRCIVCAAIDVNADGSRKTRTDADELAQLDLADWDESRVLIEGNEVRDADNGIQIVGVGAVVEVRDNSVAESGIAIASSDAPALVVGNQLTDDLTAISVRGLGAPVTIEDNVIEGGKAGIILISGNPTVLGNVVENVEGRGIVIGSSAKPTLSGNRSCGNATNLWRPENAEPIATDGNDICADIATQWSSHALPGSTVASARVLDSARSSRAPARSSAVYCAVYGADSNADLPDQGAAQASG